MTLALADIASLDFQLLHTHLVSRKAGYRCMHLREACQRNDVRDLRYLHAMHATEGRDDEIEGVISGPDVLWHYKIVATAQRTQLEVLAEKGAPRALRRMGRRFCKEVLKRVAEEQGPGPERVRYSSGQFYLRRNPIGATPSHPACVLALQRGVLHPLFVSKLAGWKLALLRPR